jgi:hypothetical protein
MTILAQVRTASPVNIHPGPIASIKGCMTTTAIQASVFRRILFRATPVLVLPGNNSVSMVEVMLKTKLVPRPMKKVARHYNVGDDQVGLLKKSKATYWAKPENMLVNGPAKPKTGRRVNGGCTPSIFSQTIPR